MSHLENYTPNIAKKTHGMILGHAQQKRSCENLKMLKGCDNGSN